MPLALLPDSRGRLFFAAIAASLLPAMQASAQATLSGQSPPATPASRNGPVPGQVGAPPQAPSAAAPTGLWQRANLLGDIGPLRPALGAYGASFGLSETSEVLGNPGGGRAQAVVYEGVTEMSTGLDLQKAIGLAGGVLNASAFQLHGRGLSTNAIDNLNVVSNIEADRSIRLFELWYGQSFRGGKVDLKIGQQSADLEFIVSLYGGLFVNSSFGWPTLAAVDLPSGGPAFPLGTPGIRLRVQPTGALTALLGAFDGSPAGLGSGDPQVRDASGAKFDVRSGVFVIGEIQYAIDQGETANGLAGTYKLGAWYNSNAFTDQFFTSTPIAAARALANPARMRRNDWSVYAVMDQLVFRAGGSKDSGAGVFARAAYAPGDRNEVDVFLDGGITYRGAFGRDNDTVGLGVGWARIGDTARADDAALAAVSPGGFPIRSSETVVELTYQAQLAPWWIVQPDVQYVFNPGGGVPNPGRPAKRVGDAPVLGLRTTVTF